MAIFSFITDPIHELRASRLGNRAATALLAENYQAAEELNRRALAIMERKFGDIEQTTVYVHNLAQVFLMQDKHIEAVPFLQRLLEIREKDFGPNDPHTADAQANLATAYVDLGKHEEAEVLFRRALSTHERQLGANHPIVAAILSSLAALLRTVGNSVEAEKLTVQAEAILAEHADLQPSDWLHPKARTDQSN